MKKLLEKDKSLRFNIKKTEKQHFILKHIFKNSSFFTLIRWNAFLKLKTLSLQGSKVSLASRCLKSINRKKFNKLTNFSRHVFLKLIRSGNVNGIQKSSW